MISFLSHAMTVSGLPLVPGSMRQIDQLEQAAGYPLPPDWRYFLEVAGGDGGALQTQAVEDHSTVDDQFEFLRLDWLIEAQASLTASSVTSEILGCPVFVVSTFTGSGTRLMIAGTEAGSPLLQVDGFDDDPKFGSGSLAGTSLSSYLDALLVPPWTAERNRAWGEPLLSIRLERQASELDVRTAVEKFDTLLNGLCALDVGGRDEAVGLRNIAGPDHPWLRRPMTESGLEMVIRDGFVSSLRSGLMLLVVGLAMAQVLGGEVTDSSGCFGESGAVLSANDAAERLLRRHAVAGGIDDLVMRFRLRHF